MRRFAAYCSLLLLIGCSPSSTPSVASWSVHEQDLYYGIPVRVLFSPADPELERKVWNYLKTVDDIFNDFRPDSENGKFNAAAAGQVLPISADFAEAWRLSRDAARETGGAFDPTVAPIRQLWRAAEKTGSAPDAEQIRVTLAQCGIDRIETKTDGLVKGTAGVHLDFGGIIKGIAVDRVVAMLRQAGTESAMVQIGGETAVWGHSRRGPPHAIAIQHPTGMDQFWTVLEDKGGGFSCATSGNYRNPVTVGDRTYYHIFDPKTGLPVDTHVLSVTILFAGTGHNGLADALSTAGAVLGPQATLKLATRLGGDALVLMRSPEGDIVEEQTPGFAAMRRQP